MQTYHFWADLFDTYQSLSPFLQFLWLVVPPVFVTVMFALWLNYRLAAKQMQEWQRLEDAGDFLLTHPPEEQDTSKIDALVEKEMTAMLK